MSNSYKATQHRIDMMRRTCAVTHSALVIVLLCNNTLPAAPRLQEVRTQTIGDTTYFHVRFEKPNNLKAGRLAVGPHTEAQRRQIAWQPRLIARDEHTSAVYHRVNLSKLLPDVRFSSSKHFVPIQGLEFVGKVHKKSRAQLSLLYPTQDEPALALRNSPLAKHLRRPKWVQTNVVLDFSKATHLPNTDKVDLQTMWAEGQAARFSLLEAESGGYGFFSFACAATGRKYRVADPVLMRPKKTDDDSSHRHLFYLTTGGSAITSSLARQRLLSTDRPNREKRHIDIAKVTGITIAEHPWKKMMAGKRPDAEPLAALIPHDNYYIRFKHLPKLMELWNILSQWGANVTQMYEFKSRDYQLQHRYERQLCLPSAKLAKLRAAMSIRGIAFTGSDPYLREGSDLTVIFHTTQPKSLLKSLQPFVAEACRNFAAVKESRQKYHGITIDSFVTPLREVSLHRAVIGNYVLYSNSPVGLRRVLDAKQKRRKSLWQSLDFQYMRTVFRANEKTEDGFAFLSDAFLRQVVGPAGKIKVQRRVEAATSMTMLTHAAMFAAWETGKVPVDHKALLAAARLKPEHIYVPEGKAITWDGARQMAVSDAYNTLRFMTPLIEMPIDKVTRSEQRAYEMFRRDYLDLWRKYFDPVGMRFSLRKEQLQAEVYILPLLNNEAYNDLRRWTGGGVYPLDPSRFSKRTLLQQTMRFQSSRFFLDLFGNWVLYRLDDNRSLKRLSEQAIVSDLTGRLSTIDRLGPQPLLLGAQLKEPLRDPKRFHLTVRAWITLLQQPLGKIDERSFNYKGIKVNSLKFTEGREDLGIPSGMTAYYALIDDAGYLGFEKKQFKALIDEHHARRKRKQPPGKTVPINASIYLAPGAAKQSSRALQLFLEWQTHKRALPNNTLWYALYRSGLIDAKTPTAKRQATALNYLGFIPMSPDETKYVYRSATDEVVNRRHGSARRPWLRDELAKHAPLRRLLTMFPSMRADLRFREDGIHTTITIRRN